MSNTNPFIDVRNARAVVSRPRGNTHEPAANWQRLEALAAAEVVASGGGLTLSGIYPCSDALAGLALWAEDILDMVTTPGEIEAWGWTDRHNVRDAILHDWIPSRKSAKALLVYKPAARRRWKRDDE